MSRQNAEWSEEFASTDSRLDSILEQLNSLASPGSAPPTPAPAPTTQESGAEAPEAAEPPPVEKPPMPTVPAATRPLHSVPDPDPIAPEMGDVTEQDLHQGFPEDETFPTPEPPMLGLVPPPVEEAQLAPPPVPTEPMQPVEGVIDPAVDHAPAPVEITVVPETSNDTGTPTQSEELVFVLDGPLESDTAVDDDVDVPSPPPVPVESAALLAEDADPGWVSHHTVEPEFVSPAMPTETPAPEPAPAPDFVTADVEPEPEPEAEPAFEAPQWDEITEIATEVQEAGNVLADDAERTSPILPETLEVEEFADAAEQQFHSDEELPLPDFTGVWVDEENPSVWDNDEAAGSVPGPLEGGPSKHGISVGRNELDSLRPTEEVAVAQPQQNFGRKLQLVGVVLFGLIALAVMFLDDPAVIDELRELYDGFFG